MWRHSGQLEPPHGDPCEGSRSRVRFRPNIPEELSLKYLDGKEVANKFDRGAKQIMFTAEDGRKVYLYPNAAATISELGIGRGEPFSICKRHTIEAGKPQVQWEVKRIDPPPPQTDAGPTTTPN